MIKKIYFMGIKGVGVASLAIIAKEAGLEVAGSDIAEEFITDTTLKERGIVPLLGFAEENVKEFFGDSDPEDCLLITTGAHEGFDNPEVKAARDMNIRVLTHGQAVGEFMVGKIFGRNDLEGISVAGAHGKTTVSSMIATVLKLANYDPSYSIGTSSITSIGPAAHYGTGKYFVAEADEYVSEPHYDPTIKFLYQHPKSIIINNIDFDHPDVYRDLSQLKNSFGDFVSSLNDDGIVVVNGDDVNISDMLKRISSSPKIITFGTDTKNQFVLSDFKEDGFGSTFAVSRDGMSLGEFKLSVPGYHNAKNATGVIALLMEIGIPVQKISEGLEKFKGVKRRIEVIGKTSCGQTIIDDYAHHPEEIKKTLSAIKGAFPQGRIVVIFQFHTFSRTKALFSDFIASFSDADQVILLPTFASERHETSDEDWDQKTVDEFKKIEKNVLLIKDASSVVKYMNENLTDETAIIITMGAGDVYKIGYELRA